MAAENNYFVPKKDIFEWLESDIGVQISNPSECCNGVVYLKILDKLFPGGKIPLRKVKMDAKLDWECRNNLKILQQVFQDLDIRRSLEIERLSTGKPADNLELLQWLKGYYDRMTTGKSPDAHGSGAASGGGSNLASFPVNGSISAAGSNYRAGSAGTSVTASSNRSSTTAGACVPGGSVSRSTVASASSTVRASPKATRVAVGRVAGQSKNTLDNRKTQGLMETIQQKDQLIKQLQADLECVETESRFYFGKLRRLELMSLEPSRSSFTVAEVQYVLFTEDDFTEEASGLRASADLRTCEDTTTTSSSNAPSNDMPNKTLEIETADPTVCGVTATTQGLKISSEDIIGSPEAATKPTTTITAVGAASPEQETVVSDRRPLTVDSAV